jgi:hypothetical protein
MKQNSTKQEILCQRCACYKSEDNMYRITSGIFELAVVCKDCLNTIKQEGKIKLSKAKK